MDIFPDLAIVTGVLRNQVAITLFSKLELFLYARANLIQVLSEGFRQNLINKGVSPEKISVIPVWTDLDLIHPAPKENSFRQKYNLQNKFVVMYSGNFGYNTSLDDFIGAAELIQNNLETYFVLVGEGVKKNSLMDIVLNKKLVNVMFLPFQPRENFNTMLAASDIGIVTMSQDAYFASLPSKIFNIMASNRAILAVTPLDSEVATIIRESNCGVVVPPGHPAELAKMIIELKSNKDQLDIMGQNGRALVEKKYSRQRCVELYNQDLQKFSKLHNTL